jgi:hypothetical protein
MREQRNQKHHEEHKKQNLGNSRSRNGDSAESQEAGDEGNNQENQRVIEHVFLLPLNCFAFLFFRVCLCSLAHPICSRDFRPDTRGMCNTRANCKALKSFNDSSEIEAMYFCRVLGPGIFATQGVPFF